MSNSQVWTYRVDPSPIGQGYSSNTSPADVEAIRKRNAEEIERLLNQRGAEGWELAAVGTSNFYFKRPK